MSRIQTHDLMGDRYLIAQVVPTIIQSRPRRPHNLLIMTYVQLVKHFLLFKVYGLILYSCGRVVRDRVHNVTVLQLLIVRCYFFPETFSPSNRAGLRRCVAQYFSVKPALCLGVLEQPRVDNSSSGSNWSSWLKAGPAIQLFIPLPTIFKFSKYLSDGSPVV